VKEAASDNVTCTIVRAIHQIGHLMGLKTIAEYVEDEVTLEKVQQLGIDYVQGYAIDYPKPLLLN
ncbi:MAG: EAL domain-containing protein, partial [Cyanobacteria bacterium J06639_14]